MNNNTMRLKNSLMVFCLVIISLVISTACSRQANTYSSESGNSLSDSQLNSVINVDDLVREPERYDGIIQIKGVVAGIFKDEQMLTLIDTREYANCGVTTCPSLVLPVSWKGVMPEPEETIKITGEVKESNKKLVFVAQALENLNSK